MSLFLAQLGSERQRVELGARLTPGGALPFTFLDTATGWLGVDRGEKSGGIV